MLSFVSNIRFTAPEHRVCTFLRNTFRRHVPIGVSKDRDREAATEELKPSTDAIATDSRECATTQQRLASNPTEINRKYSSRVDYVQKFLFPANNKQIIIYMIKNILLISIVMRQDSQCNASVAYLELNEWRQFFFIIFLSSVRYLHAHHTFTLLSNWPCSKREVLERKIMHWVRWRRCWHRISYWIKINSASNPRKWTIKSANLRIRGQWAIFRRVTPISSGQLASPTVLSGDAKSFIWIHERAKINIEVQWKENCWNLSRALSIECWLEGFAYILCCTFCRRFSHLN